jgi:hypothetical protein
MTEYRQGFMNGTSLIDFSLERNIDTVTAWKSEDKIIVEVVTQLTTFVELSQKSYIEFRNSCEKMGLKIKEVF